MALLGSPLQTWSTTPPVTRSLTLVVIALSCAYQYLRYIAEPNKLVDTALSFPYLLLVPGASIWYPWTLVTSSFVETSVIELILSIVTLPLSLRYLERLWGTVETAKFILVTCGVSNIIALGLNWLEYAVLGSSYFLFGMHYHGLMALQVGCLVAFTQIIPEHQVQFFGAAKIRVKRLPMLYVTFSNIMTIIGLQSPYILIQFGWLVSWVYLRFYKKTVIEGVTLAGGIETRGDRSETFAFVHWFPPFVHYPVGLLSDAVYNAATKLKLVQSYPSTDLEAGGYAALPGGGARAEAERRRAMALKALDQRMATTNTKSPRAPPTSATTQSQVEPQAGPSRTADPEPSASVAPTEGK